MNKRQRKRKEKAARKRKAEQSTNVPASPDVIGNHKFDQEYPHRGQNNTDSKGNIPVSFKEWATNPNWSMVIFTAVLTVIAGIQAYLIHSQTETMRKEQRPWVSIPRHNIPFPTPQIHSDLAQELSVLNIGKTVARDVHTSFVVRLIPKGESPDFSYTDPDHPPEESELGAIFPDDTELSIRVAKVSFEDRPDRFGKMRRGKYTVPLSQGEYDSLTSFDDYIVVYGTVTYGDAMGITTHWTHYCRAAFAVPIGTSIPPSAASRECVRYNDADNTRADSPVTAIRVQHEQCAKSIFTQ